MKCTITMMAALAFSGVANATVKGDLRFDWARNENKTGSLLNSNSTQYKLNYMRFSLGGAVTEDVTYNVRLRFDQTAALGEDRSNSLVDLAYLTRKYSDAVSIRAGKIKTTNHGWEYDSSSADVYIYSHAYNIWRHSYAGGFAVDYTMGDHVFSVESTNNDSTGAGKDGTLIGLSYTGWIMEKMLGLKLSHHGQSGEGSVTPPTGTIAALNKETNTAVGAKYLGVHGWGFTFDYVMHAAKADGIISPTNSSYSETGWSLGAAMTEGTYRANLKYAMSEDKTETSTTTSSKLKYTNMGTALEIAPNDDPFRYHVAYTVAETAPETGDKTTDTSIFVGICLKADFLK
jgi:hypothetical protein